MSSRESTKINMAIEELSNDLTSFKNFNDRNLLSNGRLDEQLIAQQLHNFTPVETAELYKLLVNTNLPNIANLKNKVGILGILSGVVALRNELDALHGVPNGNCDCDTYVTEQIGVVYMNTVLTYTNTNNFERWCRSGGTNYRILTDIPMQGLFNMLWFNFESMLGDDNSFYNQRFNTITDLQTFLIDSYGTDNSIIINIKITAFVVVDKTDKINCIGYNQLYSRVKGTKLMNERSQFVEIIENVNDVTTIDKYRAFRNLAKTIYNNCLGTSLSYNLSTDSDFKNACASITTPKKANVRYNIPDNSRVINIEVKDYGLYSQYSNFKVFNTVTKAWEKLPAFPYSSPLVSDTAWFYCDDYNTNTQTLSSEKENIYLKQMLINSVDKKMSSMLKIVRYKFTNASGQLCYSFRLYQCGCDQFSIKQPLDNPNQVLILEIYDDTTKPRYYKAQLQSNTKDNWGYRIDIYWLKEMLIRRVVSNANTRLIPKFKLFYYDTATGVCSNSSIEYKLDWKSKGNCVKIVPSKI